MADGASCATAASHSAFRVAVTGQMSISAWRSAAERTLSSRYEPPDSFSTSWPMRFMRREGSAFVSMKKRSEIEGGRRVK